MHSRELKTLINSFNLKYTWFCSSSCVLFHFCGILAPPQKKKIPSISFVHFISFRCFLPSIFFFLVFLLFRHKLQDPNILSLLSLLYLLFFFLFLLFRHKLPPPSLLPHLPLPLFTLVSSCSFPSSSSFIVNFQLQVFCLTFPLLSLL